MGGETGIESGSRDTQRRRSDVAAADGSGASDNGIVAPPRTMDSNSASIASVESGGGDVSLGIGDELLFPGRPARSYSSTVVPRKTLPRTAAKKIAPNSLCLQTVTWLAASYRMR